MYQGEHPLTSEELEMVAMFNEVDKTPVFKKEDDLLELGEVFDEAEHRNRIILNSKF